MKQKISFREFISKIDSGEIISKVDRIYPCEVLYKYLTKSSIVITCKRIPGTNTYCMRNHGNLVYSIYKKCRELDMDTSMFNEINILLNLYD